MVGPSDVRTVHRNVHKREDYHENKGRSDVYEGTVIVTNIVMFTPTTTIRLHSAVFSHRGSFSVLTDLGLYLKVCEL